ncbi:MAG: hypothetical protein H6835_14035 [Planctomycetes bacterium]|nr:hypothetical protein [Planctomycetota bacterium]
MTLPRQHLAEEASEDDLITSCASCGCSLCIYYWDVEDQRAPEATLAALRRPRWRHPRH